MDASSNSTSARERERERLKRLPEVPASPVSKPGVLLANEIERCCRDFSLISPFFPDQLKAASYRLTVGSRYSLGGERRTLAETEEITIPPFQVAVIQTGETLNLPRDMIARWNIKVSLAYKGLIWAGGPQVDPGYQGHLFCPIYNLSNKKVTLAHGDELAVIDFVTTTHFNQSANPKTFERPPKSLLFEDYDTLESGLWEASDKIQRFDSKIEKIDTKIIVLGGLAVALIGVIIAALSVMVSENPRMIKSLQLSELLCLIGSCLAVTLSCWAWAGWRAWIRAQARPKQEGVDVANSLVLILVGIFIGVLVMFFALPIVGR